MYTRVAKKKVAEKKKPGQLAKLPFSPTILLFIWFNLKRPALNITAVSRFMRRPAAQSAYQLLLLDWLDVE